MTKVVIREAVLEDAEGIAWVHGRARQTAYIGLLPEEGLKKLDESYEQRVEDWRENIREHGEALSLFVAEADGEVVGFACGEKARAVNLPYEGFLSKIYILEAHHKKGIGRRLVSAVAQALLARGMNSMMVRVFKANPNRAFYEALGGVYLGEIDHEVWGEVYQLAGYGWENLEELILVK
jgi:GNAT superfamily N-acetyltransferase